MIGINNVALQAFYVCLQADGNAEQRRALSWTAGGDDILSSTSISKRTTSHLPANCIGGAYMTRSNVLYGAIGLLAIAATMLAVQLYRERQKSTGIEINIGERGISIEKR